MKGFVNRNIHSHTRFLTQCTPGDVYNAHQQSDIAQLYSLIQLLGRSSPSLIHALMAVCRGWLTLSMMVSSLSRVLFFSATVIRKSSLIPTTKPAHMISKSKPGKDLFGCATPPAHHRVGDDVGHHRLVKHPQEFPADGK